MSKTKCGNQAPNRPSVRQLGVPGAGRAGGGGEGCVGRQPSGSRATGCSRDMRWDRSADVAQGDYPADRSVRGHRQVLAEPPEAGPMRARPVTEALP
jgi:hypothetical protein